MLHCTKQMFAQDEKMSGEKLERQNIQKLLRRPLDN